jgi:hypothetical protein
MVARRRRFPAPAWPASGRARRRDRDDRPDRPGRPGSFARFNCVLVRQGGRRRRAASARPDVASPVSAASRALSSGRMKLRCRSLAAAPWPARRESGAVRRTARVRRRIRSRPSALGSGIWPLAARMPSAIGRSKRPDSLGRSAGARLTVMRLRRELEAGIDDGGAHAVARFLDFGIGQADQREAGQAAGEMHFDDDRRRVAGHPARGCARWPAPCRAYWPERAFSSASTRASRSFSFSRVRASTWAWTSNSSRVTRSSLAKTAAHHGLGIFFNVLGRRIGQQGAHLGAEFFKCFGSSMGFLRGWAVYHSTNLALFRAPPAAGA